MPVNRWHLSIDLDDLFNDPDHLPMDRRDEIAARLRASRWPWITTDRRRLEWLIGKLENATPADAEVWWHSLYELADIDRVWLDIDGVERRRRERLAQEATG